MLARASLREESRETVIVGGRRALHDTTIGLEVSGYCEIDTSDNSTLQKDRPILYIPSLPRALLPVKWPDPFIHLIESVMVVFTNRTTILIRDSRSDRARRCTAPSRRYQFGHLSISHRHPLSHLHPLASRTGLVFLSINKRKPKTYRPDRRGPDCQSVPPIPLPLNCLPPATLRPPDGKKDRLTHRDDFTHCCYLD